MDNNSVKENILKLRKEMGITQKEMAEKLDMSRVAYANLESGATRTINAHVEKAAEIGNIPLEELLFGKKHPVNAALEDARAEYSRQADTLVARYETIIAEKDREIKMLKDLVSTLQENVDYQKDIISLLKRSRSGEND